MKQLALMIACAALLLAIEAPAQRRTAPAQTDVSGGRKLLAVKSTGSSRYSDAQILAASGLKLGEPAAEADFRQAAQHLLGSGMFNDVAYTFTYSEAGIKVEFKLTDVDGSKLIPARFDNFVGVSDSELRAEIERRVPLFLGQVSLNGELTGEVLHALQGMLEERHLPGEVDTLREGETDETPPTSIAFRVRGLKARIRSIEFPGSTPEQTAFLTYGARKIVGAAYSSTLIEKAIHDDLQPLFLERGYLKASFGAPETRVLTPASTQNQSSQPPNETGETSQAADEPSDEIEIDVILGVNAGKQYSVTAVDWKGNSAVSSKEASSLFHLVSGQLADAARLERDVESLTDLYRRRGYVTASISADPDINEAAGTVRYQITVKEGELYRMGELEFVGVDTESKGRLLDAWKLPEGAPYNPEYARKFLGNVSQYLPKGLQYTTKLSEDRDAKAKVVDVTIRFKAD